MAETSGAAVDLAALAAERRARAGEACDKTPKAAPKQKKSTSSSGGGVSSSQKALLVVAAVLVGPALLKQFYDKVSTEKVDLSNFNVVTSYETPAIEMMDDTVRIQFCAN
jgi:hypothetical protein